MLNPQNWSPVVLLCLVGCGVGLLLAAGVVFRLGFNIVRDVLGGIVGGPPRLNLPAPPPRPGPARPAMDVQSAPPLMTFDEALARQRGMAAPPPFAAAPPPFAAAPAPPSFPAQHAAWPVPGVMPPAGLPPASAFPMPLPGAPPAPSPFPAMQPGAPINAPRPSLTPGVPFVPGQMPMASPMGSFGVANDPFALRRAQRRAGDDRYDIYTDEDDAGGGLGLLG